MNIYPYIRDTINEKQKVKVGHHYTGLWIIATLMSQSFLLDNDKQTPLYYAVVYEREVISECLVKHNTDT
ncbi:hypothetical protein AHAS_Ahas19G0265600 [Arachis hypogaea]